MRPWLVAKHLTLFISLFAAGPVTAFESLNRSDYIIDLYGILNEMEEPPLPVLVKDDSSIFRALRFGPPGKPTVFRIETFPDDRPARLTHVVVHGSGGNPMGNKKAQQRDLTARELEKLRLAFAEARICGSPLRAENFGMDSYFWVFEFANATRHCAVERYVPPEGDPYDTLGTLLESLVR